MDVLEKLEILADAAKYDASCSSSGVARSGKQGSLGAATAAGICHSFSADGRCISLLKVLMTNVCAFDCSYCINRLSNDVPRACFTPGELAELTIEFYRRNYIEGLFLSSGVLKNPDYTMERMVETLRLLREEMGFRGYIHAKTIPGASPDLVRLMGCYADRVSVNIELPSKRSLALHAPQKAKTQITAPMAQICNEILESKDKARHSGAIVRKELPRFAPAGQSTQMIIGATPESDKQILALSSALYKKYLLKRVFFSAYLPVNDDKHLPGVGVDVPLTREHRLYQADWLMRFYGFEADELFSQGEDNLELGLDPKASWALKHLDLFPLEVNTASYEELLRVPGIGLKTARRIVQARLHHRVSFDDLQVMGLSLKRAGWFLMCRGRMAQGFSFDPAKAKRDLEQAVMATGAGRKSRRGQVAGQMTLFDAALSGGVDPYALGGRGASRLLSPTVGKNGSVLELSR